ncbi:phospho-acceptor domain-containing protein [Spirosoma oryzae]|uniref:histidine kinase n=2 Tax=Spirosoma oryzae TaxID=1469603 RepID=A0A2T0TNN2_9BACT|nr:phospho-acceptor domain-containing protein [Spirosoma oryzae]
MAMKKPVNLILWLMSLCVTGVVGLQLFWNYQNYQRTVATFRHDSNEALRIAVDQEMAQRRRVIIDQTKRWLADTSFIRITCSINKRYGRTVFNINDRYPKVAGSGGMSFSLADFTPKLTRMTPQARQLVIDHIGDNLLHKDLKEGSVYYFTQRLGDSIVVAFQKSRLRLPVLDTLYRQALASRDIQSPFKLNPADTSAAEFLTQPVNASMRRPYKRELVWASLASPSRYFFAHMKWVLLSTLLLIGVCVLCFGYTVKTLLSQHKLAELRKDFINNMTHEFNTPLASIKITTEALKTFAHDPATQQEYLTIIGYQTDKLTELTSRVLQANRQLTTPAQPWQPIDLRTLVNKAIEEMAVRLQYEQAAVRYEPGQTPILVKGEAGSLLTVFVNLLDNALKYAPGGLKLDIQLAVKNRWAEIVFSDKGIGIPTEYRTQIFEPFFRVPQGNVHTVKGYGLGLNQVWQILQQHRGSVLVGANEPVGSQFIVRLPLL